MSAQPVRLVYCNGRKDSLAKAAEILMYMQLAFYYSKDFIRVKTRRPDRVSSVLRELRDLKLKVRVVVCD